MKIQPISTFYNGETIELTNFVLKSIGDNMSLEPLKGVATLYYELQSISVNEDGSETYTNVITATLDISGTDYDNWNNNPTSNNWAYNWAANKLNLVPDVPSIADVPLVTEVPSIADVPLVTLVPEVSVVPEVQNINLEGEVKTE